MTRPFDFTPEAIRTESVALIRIARAVLGDEHAAEDVRQDTWIAALQSPPRRDENRSAWLGRVARNFALKVRRQTRTRDRRERAAARDEALPSTLDAMERACALHRIGDAVLALDEPYRSTLVLRFWEGLPPRAIARRMGVPVETVRTRQRRALALLRERLDLQSGGRAAWAAPLAASVPRPGTNATPVLRPLASSLAGVAIMSLKTKLVAAAAAAVLLIAAGSWIAWRNPRGHRIESPGERPPVARTTASAKATRGHPEEAAVVRRAVEGELPAPGSESDPPEVGVVPPYELRVHVIDSRGDAAPHATVEVWRPRPRASPGSYSLERAGPTPLLTARADADGRCSLVLDRDFALLHARADDLGASMDVFCRVPRSERDRERVLQLLEPVTVLGRVLGADGLPVVDTEVRVSDDVIARGDGVIRGPGPARTDANGQFRTEVFPDAYYRIEAGSGDGLAEAQLRTGAPGSELEITLRIPGGWSIQGTLVDPNGMPVEDGQVQVWEVVSSEQYREGIEPILERVETSEDGRFRIAASRPGHFELLGSADGFATSALLELDVTDVRPHLDLAVRLLDFGTLTGVVRRADGTPLAGALVGAVPEQGRSPFLASLPNRDDQFGRVAPSTTDASGAFELTGVHPGPSYRIRCRPNPDVRQLFVERPGVLVGGGMIDLVVSERDLEGTTVRGRVLAAESGTPIEGFEIELVQDYGGMRATSKTDFAQIESGSYTLPRLAAGVAHSVKVLADGFGPFEFTIPAHAPAEYVHDVRLERCGAIRCTVKDDEGRPHINVRVAAVLSGRTARPTDAAGIAQFEGLLPGDYQVWVAQDDERVGERTVTVPPGQTTEVELRVPR